MTDVPERVSPDLTSLYPHLQAMFMLSAAYLMIHVVLVLYSAKTQTFLVSFSL